MRELENKVALITGAGRGIGSAIACGFANAGASVCCSSRTESQIAAVAATINGSGGNAISVPSDITNQESIEQLFENAYRHFGAIDIVVVNAAAGTDGKSVEDGDPAQWKSIIDANLSGAYLTAKAAIPYLRKSDAGKIIFIGSGTGHRAIPNSSAYACSKAGLWMLVRVLAQELAESNICVNELVPGPVDTAMLRTSDAANLAQISRVEWVKTPEDVVPLAVLIAAQPGRGPTGQSYSLTRREL